MKKKRKKPLKIQYLVLGLLCALVAGAAIGVLQKADKPSPTPTSEAGILDPTPTEPAPTTRTTATTPKRKVEVVPRPVLDPFAEVAAILDPFGPGKSAPLPPFDPERLQAYGDDGAESPLRQSVREAVKQLKTMEPILLSRQLTAPAKADPKKFISELIEPLLKKLNADLARLESLQADLEDQLPGRREPRRWQANHDFVTSRVLAHLVQNRELTLQLRILRSRLSKGEAIPAGGWELLPEAALATGNEVETLVRERDKLLQRLIKDHKDTPWQQVAEREQVLPLSLRPRAIKKP